MDPVVVRLPRVDPLEDEAPPFVLVHVASAGSGPLDLNLIGTDNTSGFAVSLKQDQPSSHCKKNSSVNQEDWEAILSAILLGTATNHAAATKDVEAVAKVESGHLKITLQRRIGDIRQQLGSISLPESEAALEDIDLYEWCGLIITSRDATTSELKSRNTALQDKDEQVKKLEESLAELVKSKTDYENQLLEKFSLLLNEKKLKIRDQQRLLASSNVDPAKLEAVEESRAIRGHSAGPSRKGKRKAGPVREESDSESDGGFEKMEVDEAPNESEQEQAQTADESTADEADSEDEAPSPPTRKPEKKNGEGSSAANASSSRAPRKEDTAPPPKRDLPFGKKPAPPAAKPVLVLEGSETESDDEL